MTDRNYGAVREAASFEKFVNRIIADGKPFGFDIEASYDAPEFIDKGALLQFHPTWFLTGFSFTNSTDWARYVPIAHADGNNVDDPVRTARALWNLLNTGLGVAHNLSYELKGISRWFRELLWNDTFLSKKVRETLGFFPYRSDSQLEVWLLAKYEPLQVGKDLKGVVKAEFGHEMVHFDDLFKVDGKKRASKDKRFHLLSSLDPTVINYACEDSLWCLALHELHYEQVLEEFNLIYRTEMALLPVLVEMEMGPVDENGVAQGNVLLDWKTIHDGAVEVKEFGDLMNEDILTVLSERLGRTVNINLASVQQLSKVLYDPIDGLGLQIKKRSKVTSAPSTGDDALKVIAKSDPVIRMILDYRQVRKLYSSYLHKYDTELNYGPGGTCFPNHNQMGALTGRQSVDHVSYQQWPKPYHYELKKSGRTFDFGFKDLLLSPPHFRVVGFDFSQVELRIMAGMAGETTLLAAFASGQDIHKATAAAMMGIPVEQVTKKQRAVGKTLNFAIAYGSGAENIAEMLTTPEDPVTTSDAEEMLKKYFAGFPKLKGWMDQEIALGHESGYVTTLFGRKFTVWEYRSINSYIRSKGDRMCVNAPVQGGAADYMKLGMVRAQRAIKAAGMQDKIRLIMTIHDALEFYVHESVTTQEVIDLIGPMVSFPVKGLPEIRADWHEGPRWGSVAEVKLDVDKQIIGYRLDDVEEEFETYQDAVAYLEAKRAPAPKPEPEILTLPALDSGSEWSTSESSSATRNQDDDEEPPWLHGAEYKAQASKRAIITITEMPDEEQFLKFSEFLDERPGPMLVTMSTPEGDVDLEGGRHRITASDQPQISLILGGASLRIVDLQFKVDAIAEGVTL